MSTSRANQLTVDPSARARVAPELYMQFMEPLGLTDGSVEAAWDFERSVWREDFANTLKELSPGCIRWGGILSGYYRWREGVGPRHERVPMRNYKWDGWEQNQVGTDEFVGLCRDVGAEPLLAVNFLGDGRPEYGFGPDGAGRAAGPDEAAEWVSYCNDPDNKLRHEHGRRDPYGVRLWQVGNETSYRSYGFTQDETIRHTREFVSAMKKRDPSIEVIAWGDRDVRDQRFWAPAVIDGLGSEIDMIALHLMQMKPTRENTVLSGRDYMENRELAWRELNEILGQAQEKLLRAIDYIHESGADLSLAVTEGHLSLQPHNSSPLLNEWLSALFHARLMNLYERNSDTIRIATLADFCGTRWTVNALMIPVPWTATKVCYLMPAGRIMSLFGRNRGDTMITCVEKPSDLDISATRTDDAVYLHVCNTNLHEKADVTLGVKGRRIIGGKVHEIAPDDIGKYIDQDHVDAFTPNVKDLLSTSSNASTKRDPGYAEVQWTFPPASVSVVRIRTTGMH